MNFIKKYWLLITASFLVALFLFLRFYNLDKSFFFQNDQGRDMLVLWDWKTTGKPPLLGPQTSALPINQSSLYFYFLYPGFLLSQGQPISANYTLAFFYVASLLLGIWWLKRDKKLLLILLFTFFLISIHPQYIIQNRMVWNPSFVGLFLISSLLALVRWLKDEKTMDLAVFALSAALAVSFSYSVAPVLLACLIYILFAKKKLFLKSIAAVVTSLILINITTLIFEMRHGFLITKSLFSRGISPQAAVNITIQSRVNNFINYGVSSPNSTLNILVILAAVLLVIYVLVSRKSHKISRELGILWLLSFVFSLLLPVQIHTHYIFGITTLMFLFLASLPIKFSLTISAIFVLIYLNPATVSKYFSPSVRSVAEMSSCFKKVCSEQTAPIFVTVQANFHPYHNGPEHRFLMKEAGCNVKYIEEPDQSANLMAVVLDGSNYIQGQTSYNELTMFGKSKEIKRYNCQPNFGVVILKKD